MLALAFFVESPKEIETNDMFLRQAVSDKVFKDTK